MARRRRRPGPAGAARRRGTGPGAPARSATAEPRRAAPALRLGVDHGRLGVEPGHRLDDGPRDVLRGEPDVGEHLGALAVVEELLRDAERHGPASARRRRAAPGRRPHPTPPARPLSSTDDDEPVRARPAPAALPVDRLDPARVDHGDADALVRPAASATSSAGRAIAPTETTRTSASPVRRSTSMPPTPVDGGDVGGHARPWGSAPPSGRRRPSTASRSSSRSVARVARRGQPQPGHDLQDGHVPHAVVAGPVVAGDPGPVEHERDAGAVQRDVHQHLVEGPVEERRVDGDHRVQAAERHARGATWPRAARRCRRRRPGSGYARAKRVQADRLQHRGGDRHDVAALARRARPSRRRRPRSRSCRRRSAAARSPGR